MAFIILCLALAPLTTHALKIGPSTVGDDCPNSDQNNATGKFIETKGTCVCPKGLTITAQLGQHSESVPAKKCEYDMAKLAISKMTMYCGDYCDLAYTAEEINNDKQYHLKGANVASVMAEKTGGQRITVVDVGANVGFTSIAIAKLYPHADIFSYELNPGTYAMLKQNIDANKVTNQVQAYNAGVSGTNQSLKLSWCAITTRYGSQTLGSDDVIKPCGSKGCKMQHKAAESCAKKDLHVDVPTISFSSILAERRYIDLLKMDCEGCEYQRDQNNVTVIETIQKALSDGKIKHVTGECHGFPSRERTLCERLLKNRRT